MIRRPPSPTLFPYPPLSRSCPHEIRKPNATPKRVAASRTGISHRLDEEADRDRDAHERGGCREAAGGPGRAAAEPGARDRKSTRLNSSHPVISYAALCFKKK